MNAGLAQIYAAYHPKKKLKRRLKPQRSSTNSSSNLAARRHQFPSVGKETVDMPAPRSGKSLEPQRLPRLPRLQSKTPEPTHLVVKQMLDRSASSSVDVTLDRLEKLQFKSITARSEWLLVQERKLALGMLNRQLVESLDEMEELQLDNKFEVLLHKQSQSKPVFTPAHLPRLTRASPL